MRRYRVADGIREVHDRCAGADHGAADARDESSIRACRVLARELDFVDTGGRVRDDLAGELERALDRLRPEYRQVFLYSAVAMACSGIVAMALWPGPILSRTLNSSFVRRVGQISYGGYWRPDHRSFIDQILVTKNMKDQIEEVKVFTDGLAKASSDHYPVYIRIKTDPRRLAAKRIIS
jgi:hypothetical protein